MTLEDRIALLIATLMAVVSSLIEAVPLPGTARNRLHKSFAKLFVRLAALFAEAIEQHVPTAPLKLNPAARPAKPQAPAQRPRTKTRAPTAISSFEAPQPTRAPEPHHPTRAPRRAVAPSIQPAIPVPQTSQKTAFTNPKTHAYFVTTS